MFTLLNQQQTSFAQARSLCQATLSGADLAILELNDFPVIRSMVNSSGVAKVRIGLQQSGNIEPDFGWSWVDSSEFDHRLWKLGALTGANTNDDCACFDDGISECLCSGQSGIAILCSAIRTFFFFFSSSYFLRRRFC
jgi:hypothetical protein